MKIFHRALSHFFRSGRTLVRDRRGSSDLAVPLLMTLAGVAAVSTMLPKMFDAGSTAADTLKTQANALQEGAQGGGSSGGLSGSGSSSGWNINGSGSGFNLSVGSNGVSVSGGGVSATVGGNGGSVSVGSGSGGSGGSGGGGGGSTSLTTGSGGAVTQPAGGDLVAGQHLNPVKVGN